MGTLAQHITSVPYPFCNISSHKILSHISAVKHTKYHSVPLLENRFSTRACINGRALACTQAHTYKRENANLCINT
jgi:hypothetical protein